MLVYGTLIVTKVYWKILIQNFSKQDILLQSQGQFFKQVSIKRVKESNILIVKCPQMSISSSVYVCECERSALKFA